MTRVPWHARGPADIRHADIRAKTAVVSVPGAMLARVPPGWQELELGEQLMDLDARKAKATELARTGWYGDGVPLKNLFMRVLALVGDAEILWVGGALQWSGRDVHSGPIFFFTDDVLVLGHLKDFTSTNGGGYGQGSADLQVIARACLTAVALPQRDDEATPANRNETWVHVDQDGWSRDGCVVLTYKGLKDPITIRKDQLSNFALAVPELVKDLARR